MTACQTTEEFPVTTATVAPATGIAWLGEATPLRGETRLKVGMPLPEVQLTNVQMKTETLGPSNQVQVIDTLPSLDTPVCDRQTHILGARDALDPKIRRVTVSLDLPYAQRRFAAEAHIDTVDFLSDYRTQAFGKATGLQIDRNGLLARAVIVVDAQGIVRHLQIVPEITQMPDMAKAFAVAQSLAKEL